MIYGSLSLLQERYPFLAASDAFLAALDAQTVCKTHYDSCASFKDEIHALNNASEKHEDSLRKAISDTLAENGTVKRG